MDAAQGKVVLGKVALGINSCSINNCSMLGSSRNTLVVLESLSLKMDSFSRNVSSGIGDGWSLPKDTCYKGWLLKE